MSGPKICAEPQNSHMGTVAVLMKCVQPLGTSCCVDIVAKRTAFRSTTTEDVGSVFSISRCRNLKLRTRFKVPHPDVPRIELAPPVVLVQ